MIKSYRIEYNRKKIELMDLISKNNNEISKLKYHNIELRRKLKKLNTDNLTYKQGLGLKKFNKVKRNKIDDERI